MALRTLSLWDLDKLIRSAGAERVDEKASRKLGEILEDEANTIIERARVYAKHAGRSFITRNDIMLAAQHSHA
ncbi:MAG: NFYB/HAP3 family transcription factor subunit [Candidatus Norongarragalinales archaeon]